MLETYKNLSHMSALIVCEGSHTVATGPYISVEQKYLIQVYLICYVEISREVHLLTIHTRGHLSRLSFSSTHVGITFIMLLVFILLIMLMRHQRQNTQSTKPVKKKVTSWHEYRYCSNANYLSLTFPHCVFVLSLVQSQIQVTTLPSPTLHFLHSSIH